MPLVNPANANITKAKSFHKCQFNGPYLSGYKTQISFKNKHLISYDILKGCVKSKITIIAGNANPKMLRQNAPNNDMNNPRCGTAAATKNVNIVVTILNPNKYLSLFSDFLMSSLK